MRPARPEDEEARSAKAAALGTAAENADLDDFAELASQVCGTPIALVTLIIADVEKRLGAVGAERKSTPRDDTFCAHAILHPEEVLTVEDATKDPRFSDNPAVLADPGIRFYAGAPLVTSDGFPLGSVCAIDHQPRALSAAQERALRALARQAAAHLEMRHFLGISVHALGNPLVPLKLSAHALRAEVTTPRAERALESLERNLDRISSVVREMQEAAAVVSRNVRVDRTRQDLRPIVRETVRRHAAPYGCRPRIVAEPDHEVMVDVDAARLAGVLRHLLAIADRAAPGARIDVELTTARGEAGVEFRLPARPLDEPGAMGLYVSRAIVEAHGGTLTVTDREGGAVIRVALPLPA